MKSSEDLFFSDDELDRDNDSNLAKSKHLCRNMLDLSVSVAECHFFVRLDSIKLTPDTLKAGYDEISEAPLDKGGDDMIEWIGRFLPEADREPVSTRLKGIRR